MKDTMFTRAAKWDDKKVELPDGTAYETKFPRQEPGGSQTHTPAKTPPHVPSNSGKK